MAVLWAVAVALLGGLVALHSRRAPSRGRSIESDMSWIMTVHNDKSSLLDSLKIERAPVRAQQPLAPAVWRGRRRRAR